MPHMHAHAASPADAGTLIRVPVDRATGCDAPSADRVIAREITYRYETDKSLPPVLDNVDLSLKAGEFVILSGPSGSGKTTMLTLVGGLRRHQQGRMQVLGRDLAGIPETALTALRRDIGFVFQEHNLFDALTPRETLQLAMRLHPANYHPQDFEDRPRHWLDRVGLGGLLDTLPAKLSTGQRQRVAIARALINNPSLILADEPTASLDPESARVTMQCLTEAVREHRAALLLISHDQRQFVLADRVVTLVDGRATGGSPPQ
jgi:putative ABC transport system ATP-binding protein